MNNGLGIGWLLILGLGLILLIIVFSYKKCPSSQVMVVSGAFLGKDRKGVKRRVRYTHAGSIYVIPFFQKYEFLDLHPIQFKMKLRLLSKEKIPVDVFSNFTIGISSEAGVMENAAKTLLGVSHDKIREMAKDIIKEQLNLEVSRLTKVTIEELKYDKKMERFLDRLCDEIEREFKKIGLWLINININEIKESSLSASDL